MKDSTIQNVVEVPVTVMVIKDLTVERIKEKGEKRSVEKVKCFEVKLLSTAKDFIK